MQGASIIDLRIIFKFKYFPKSFDRLICLKDIIIMDKLAKVLLFGSVFAIGLNTLFHPSLYENEWKESLKALSVSCNELILIECFGGLLLTFSMLSLLFDDKNFDLALLFLLIISSAAVYNPFDNFKDEKNQLNIALISSLLLQRTSNKKREALLKKEN